MNINLDVKVFQNKWLRFVWLAGFMCLYWLGIFFRFGYWYGVCKFRLVIWFGWLNLKKEGWILVGDIGVFKGV